MDESRNPVVLNVIHCCQNPLESARSITVKIPYWIVTCLAATMCVYTSRFNYFFLRFKSHFALYYSNYCAESCMFLVLHDACCMRFLFEDSFAVFTMTRAHMLLYVYNLSIIMTSEQVCNYDNCEIGGTSRTRCHLWGSSLIHYLFW
jgi:hypothetical protein